MERAIFKPDRKREAVEMLDISYRCGRTLEICERSVLESLVV